MNVLMSVKPVYVSKIIEGTKKYEFRKSIFKKRSVDLVYIYSSHPVKKIVGKFTIGDILEDRPDNLWDAVKDQSGLDESEFFNYFEGRSKGYAIGIDEFTPFKDPIDPRLHYDNFVPPQSFCYVDNEIEEFCRY